MSTLNVYKRFILTKTRLNFYTELFYYMHTPNKCLHTINMHTSLLCLFGYLAYVAI